MPLLRYHRYHHHLLIFFLFPLLLFSTYTSFPNEGFSVLIDCGATGNTAAAVAAAAGNGTWLSDRYYSGGSASAVVAQPQSFPRPQERTLRFFPPSASGKKGCYSVPVPAGGRYYLRLFTVYDNYDSKLRPPAFDVSVGTALVFSWRRPWPGSAAQTGAYTDLFVFAGEGGALDVCFYSISTDAPVVGSIEVVAVDPLSYDAATTGRGLLLVNYGRISSGPDLFGPGFTDDADRFGRVWQPDTDFRSPQDASSFKVLSTERRILGADLSPNHFPARLYQTAVTTAEGNRVVEYLLPVDTELDYMLWFHFAEIDLAVTKPGQRVFDVMIDGAKVKRIDIFAEVGGFSAFKWQYVVRNLTNVPLSVKLVAVVGMPLISGLENYAMVFVEPATISSQVVAMKALKESLKIPDRMGWNGDPCAPSAWDAWEGVTCHKASNGPGLVITQLDLSSQGLKGYISDKISLLTNLISLNMSSNTLEGTLPLGIGQGYLVRVDLSGNQLSGIIPDSLGSSNLQLVLLNNNELEGQVPGKLYSVGVHGGVIDLSGNKGLCGVPSLPACSLFGKATLSTRDKVTIGLSCAVLLLSAIILVVYFSCIRRRNDYEFVILQESTPAETKRSRYRKSKSLAHLETEMQNVKLFPSTSNPI